MEKHLTMLKEIVSSLYLFKSEEELLHLIQHKLLRMCEVEQIKLTCKKIEESPPHNGAKKVHSVSGGKTKKTFYAYGFKYKEEDYSIQFHKSQGFSKEEKPFLKKVGKALASALLVAEKHKQWKVNKEQWELAFDTIPTAICLTDLKGNIIKTNKTFREKTKISQESLRNKNYFSAFFPPEEQEGTAPQLFPPVIKKEYKNSTPLGVLQCHCEKNTPHCGCIKTKALSNTPLEEKPHYNITSAKKECICSKNHLLWGRYTNKKKQVFEIVIRRFYNSTERAMQLVILRDISRQVKSEHKIAQSAKTAELDIISHSIAHELNNPIAGIYTLLQALQMQQHGKNLNEDLKEMSFAVQRCNHIIHKLLSP